MIGKILTVSDETGQEYVEKARTAWLNQGFYIDSESIENALSHGNLDEYFMIALTMDQEHSSLFQQYVKLLRTVTSAPIILFPYAPAAKADVLNALYEGATQIIALPTDMHEAIANCIALIRHFSEAYPRAEKPLTMYADYKIFLDIDRYCAHVAGKIVELSKYEFEILKFLMEHRGGYLSAAQIYEAIWGYEYIDAPPDMLWTHMKNLRRKLQWSPDLPQYIRTKRGVGYSFAPRFISLTA